MSFPSDIDSFTPNVDDVDDVIAEDVNELQTAIEAIETELGTDPAGSCTDLKTRLAHSINNAGMLEFDDATELTISSGAITVTQNFHKVDTEADASTDYLDTINGGTAGMFLLIRTVSDSRDITIRHYQDNIYCAGGDDITLGLLNEFAFGVYDNSESMWMLAKGSGGSDITTTAGAAVNHVAIYSAANNIGGTAKLQFNGASLIIGDGTADVDYSIIFNGEDNDCYITWWEDEDYLKPTKSLMIADGKNIILDTTTGTKIGTATDQKLGFFNATPVVQQTELTDELTTITFTAPGTPDYALQDLTDSGGFGFVTKDEGNTVMSVIANLQARVNELETKLVALGLLADAD